MNVIKQVQVNGNKVRVVLLKDGTYRAQSKTWYQHRFQNFSGECETFDHAFYWAFEAIHAFFQDTRPLSRRTGGT